MYIIELLSKTNQGNQRICVMTDRYFKLTRAISMSKTSPTHMTNIFLIHWTTPLGISTYLLMDSRPQFVCKLFTLVCEYLGIKHLKTAACHLQTNRRAKQLIQTVVIRFRHYVAEHGQNWEMCVQPHLYTHNTQIH